MLQTEKIALGDSCYFSRKELVFVIVGVSKISAFESGEKRGCDLESTSGQLCCG